MGNSNIHKGYKCLHKETGCLYIYLDVVFNDTGNPFSLLAASLPSPMAFPLLISSFPNAYSPFTEGVMCPHAPSQSSNQIVLRSPMVPAPSIIPVSNDIYTTSDVSATFHTNLALPI